MRLMTLVLVALCVGCPYYDDDYRFIMIEDYGGPPSDAATSTYTAGVDIAAIRAFTADGELIMTGNTPPSLDADDWCEFGTGDNSGAASCSYAWDYWSDAEPRCGWYDEGIGGGVQFTSLGGLGGWLVVELQEPVQQGDRVEVWECESHDLLDPEHLGLPSGQQEFYDISIGTAPDPPATGEWILCGGQMAGGLSECTFL